MSYRRILVPVDGSAASKRSLREAIRIAGNGARLRLIHVLDDLVLARPPQPILPPAASERMVAALDKAAEEVLREAESSARKGGAEVESAVVRSRGRYVADTIVREAKRWRADVIVMGTHGRGGIRRLLLGSDAEGVLHQAPVPVLLVRSKRA